MRCCRGCYAKFSEAPHMGKIGEKEFGPYCPDCKVRMQIAVEAALFAWERDRRRDLKHDDDRKFNCEMAENTWAEKP